MAGKSRYTDDEKAAVLAILEVNEGNVKRTARETGLAEQTIRDWKKSWEREGVPAEIQAASLVALEDFATRAESIRDKMLNSLEAKVLNEELTGRDLITGIGVLTDKLRISRGEATSKTDNTVTHVTSPNELANKVLKALDRALTAGEQRDEEIVDAEWADEQAAQAELAPAPLNH